MPISVQLEDERGTRLAEAVDIEGLVDRAVREASQGSAVLRYVDPYGDTVLNSLQVGPFLEEWNAIQACAETPQQRETWEQVREIALR